MSPMQKKSNEGGRGTATTRARKAQRIHQGTHRINALRRGVLIGFGDFTLEDKTLPGGSSYLQLSCPKFFLSYIFSVEVLEGKSIGTILNDVENVALTGPSFYKPPFLIPHVGPLLPGERTPYFTDLVLASVDSSISLSPEVMLALVKNAKGS